MDALLHLLSAPSKQAVDEFLCACAREREQLAGPGPSRLSEIAATFGIGVVEARQLQRAGTELVGEAVYRKAATPDLVAALFEADFHADLRSLLARILVHRFEEWQAASLAAGGISAMPKLQSASWQVYRNAPASTGGAAAPAVLLNLALGNDGLCTGSRDVKVEMGKEQLEALVASLSKVKEQVEATTLSARRRERAILITRC